MEKSNEKQTLAVYRQRMGYAQFDVANEMGISQAKYSQYESGRRSSKAFELSAREAIQRLAARENKSELDSLRRAG